MRWRRRNATSNAAADGAPRGSTESDSALHDPAAGGKVPRVCREVQAVLPSYADGRLGGLRRRAVRQHLKRCTTCQASLELHQRMQSAFAPAADDGPPPELLESLLARVERRSWREKAAVPVRGAVSGVRPVLSAVLLTGAALAGTGVGWAGWQAARRVSAALRQR